MKKFLSVIMILVLVISAFSSSMISTVNAAEAVESILSGMSTEEKIAQTMMMDFSTWNGGNVTSVNQEIADLVADNKFGAVIYSADSMLSTENAYNLSMGYQKAVTSKGGVPMIIATDHEGGSIAKLSDGTALPGNMAIGAAGSTTFALQSGNVIGSELNAVGINATFAPNIDISNANNSAIGTRSYGDDPTKVGMYASKFGEGLNKYNVIGCAKFFPGTGDAVTDSDTGLLKSDKTIDALKENELKPFSTVISGGTDMIMVANLLCSQIEKDTVLSDKTGEKEALPASLSDDIITGVLRGSMKYDGVVCTDSLAVKGISKRWGEVQAYKLALNAGADLINAPISITSLSDADDITSFITNVKDAVEKKEITSGRLDDAVRRILTLKKKKGILDFNASDFTLSKAKSVVGNKTNRTIEKSIAGKAVTLVKNSNSVLPLDVKEGKEVLFMTPNANQIALMALGWNRAKAAGIIPTKNKVRLLSYGGEEMDKYKSAISGAEYLVIASEIASSDDIKNKNFKYTVVKELVDYAKSLKKTVVVMSVLSPYDVQFYSNADAVVAVYGSMGTDLDAGDVLNNKVTDYKNASGPNIVAGVEAILGVNAISGKLPVNIPVIDMANYKYTDEVKYNRDYGLSTKAKEPISSETSSASSKSTSSKNSSKVTSTTSKSSGTTSKASSKSSSATVSGQVQSKDIQIIPIDDDTDITKVKKPTFFSKGYKFVKVEGDLYKKVSLGKAKLGKKYKVKTKLKKGKVQITLTKIKNAKKYRVAFKQKNSDERYNYIVWTSRRKFTVSYPFKKGKKYLFKYKAKNKKGNQTGWSKVYTSAKAK